MRIVSTTSTWVRPARWMERGREGKEGSGKEGGGRKEEERKTKILDPIPPSSPNDRCLPSAGNDDFIQAIHQGSAQPKTTMLVVLGTTGGSPFRLRSAGTVTMT